MKTIFYPDTDNAAGPVLKFLKNLKRDPELLTMVHSTLKKVETSSDLSMFEKQGWVEKMPFCKNPIYEFKIPPTRRKGVARLYFGYSKNKMNTIIILSAEKKQGRIKANKEKIKQAEQRYLEVCI